LSIRNENLGRGLIERVTSGAILDRKMGIKEDFLEKLIK